MFISGVSKSSVSVLSDMDYLRSKIVDGKSNSTDSEDDGADTVQEESLHSEKVNSQGQVEETQPTEPHYTLKMRGVPFSSKPKDVQAFFYPLKLLDIRMVPGHDGKPTGVVFVDFSSQADMMDGLRRNRDCMGRRYIELFREDQLEKQVKASDKPPRPWDSKKNDIDAVESIGESGRLFIRNLSYSITEEDLTNLFEKYGPLTEVNLPLDKTTNRSIGLGFVTYMLPEHAVKAYSELDRQIFQGRLLHILPSKPPVMPSTKALPSSTGGTSSYKKSKESSLKDKSASAHNWNSLFLGSNAVVDSMVDRYDVGKSDLLDPNADQSLAVRVALGETQLVAETREFLEEQGVVLEMFEQAKPKRSKRIILVKNLVFGTTDKELKELFEPFGSPARIILPPEGVSALVEYSDPSTAKKAFKQLAYSEFKHVPVYLEWAPTGVLGEGRGTMNRDTATGNSMDGSLQVKEMESSCNHLQSKHLHSQVQLEPTVAEETEQKSSKLLVRNIPFEAKKKEVMELFGTFGRLKSVRLPKKMGSSSEHRGFCFVEFVTKEDAKRAFESLRHSTHLYGRRLVLEWAEADDSVSTIRQKTARYFSTGEELESVAKRKKKLVSKLLGSLGASDDIA